MLARFIGADHSLGYRTGVVYNLTVVQRWGVPSITHPTPCPYGSWDAFWKNWEPI